MNTVVSKSRSEIAVGDILRSSDGSHHILCETIDKRYRVVGLHDGYCTQPYDSISELLRMFKTLTPIGPHNITLEPKHA